MSVFLGTSILCSSTGFCRVPASVVRAKLTYASWRYCYFFVFALRTFLTISFISVRASADPEEKRRDTVFDN
jgi:hypothetical protein